MLTDQEALDCFNYITNTRKAYKAICQHFAHRPSQAGGIVPPCASTGYGITLASMVNLAVAFAKSDWDTHFAGKEPQPTWRRHDVSTYYEQIVDLCMEHKDQFQ